MAFDREEVGLGQKPCSKWICPAMAGRAGCWARGEANLTTAREAGLPIITLPEDWETRPCCVNKTMDFTPDPTNPNHQRKLMQREYVGTRRWRRAMNLRTLVEDTFGILKNPSRQRLWLGQNRLPGLAMANLINGLKVALFNEEQLRSWHEDTGLGPADHPLLQPDPHDWGFTDLIKAQAKGIDDRYLRAARRAALILVGFASALRPSELVALTLAGIETKPGGLLLALRQSKIDSEGRAQIVGVVHGQHALTDPVAALAAWRSVRGNAPGVHQPRHDNDRAIRSPARQSPACSGPGPRRRPGHRADHRLLATLRTRHHRGPCRGQP